MIALAGTVALAASMLIATLRLRTHTDKKYGRSYIHVTPAFRLYVLLHGLAALLPFPLHLFWSKTSSALVTASPWFVAAVTPLFINQMLKLQGFDFPEATGRLGRFRSKVSTYIHEAMIDRESAAMHDFVAPFAKDVSVEEVRLLVSLYLPVQVSACAKKAAAVRAALESAKTAERAMELYIRLIGIHSFLSIFGERLREKKLAPTPLFDDDFERRRQARNDRRTA